MSKLQFYKGLVAATESPEDNSQNFLESLQKSILRRLSRSPEEEPVIYEFTQDRALLHQYYRLREAMYRKVHHIDNFVGEEDVHDKLSHILIARRGKLCIGGCRMIVREPDEGFLLPMESPDFKLRNLFPELPLYELRHGEISRFAILDDDDKLEVMQVLSKLIIEKAISLDLGYIFAKSTYAIARNWRMIGQSWGLKKTTIRMDINVPENPEYPEIKWYVMMSELPAAEPYAEDAESSQSAALLEPLMH